MPSRTTPLVTGQVYHIFNRGSEKRQIFETKRDYQRLKKTLRYYQVQGPKPKFSHFSQNHLVKLDSSKTIVEIIAYCLMPNHFHLLLRQVQDKGITEFVSKLTNSYTKYFNTKFERVGPLFQGEFKSVLIEDDEQLLHVSRYIHLNPLVSFLTEDLLKYPWSSLPEYLNPNGPGICSKGIILEQFSSSSDYYQFVKDQASYAFEIERFNQKLIDIN